MVTNPKVKRCGGSSGICYNDDGLKTNFWYNWDPKTSPFDAPGAVNGPVFPRRSAAAVAAPRGRLAAAALASAAAWQRRLPNVLTAMRVLMVPGGVKNGKTPKKNNWVCLKMGYIPNEIARATNWECSGIG